MKNAQQNQGQASHVVLVEEAHLAEADMALFWASALAVALLDAPGHIASHNSLAVPLLAEAVVLDYFRSAQSCSTVNTFPIRLKILIQALMFLTTYSSTLTYSCLSSISYSQHSG